MSADQDLSPEEKLLKVIQDGDDEATAPTAADSPATETQAAPPKHVAPAAAKARAPAKKAPPAAVSSTEPGAASGKKPEGKTVKAGAEPIGSKATTGKKAAAKPKLGVKKSAKTAEGEKPALKKSAKKKDKKAADKPDGKDAAADVPQQAPVPARAGSVRTRGGVFRTVNMALVASALLLAGAIVWEIFAARQTMPEQPVAEGLAVREATAVPLGTLAEHVELFRLRDPWLWLQKITTGSTNVVFGGGFGEVAQYVKQNMILDGVSYSAATAAESSAAITDRRRGETYFLAIGHPVPILGLIPANEPKKLTLGKVRDNGVSLSYDDQGKNREVHMQLR